MWQLDGSKASFRSTHLTGRLDVEVPAAGVTDLAVAIHPDRPRTSIDAAIMKLMLPDGAPLLIDAYVRGIDLVATYSESPNHPCQSRIYWRVESEADYFGIQILISVQTPLLDAYPDLKIVSQLTQNATRIDHGVAVAPLPGLDLCYAELADDSNLASTEVQGNRITSSLFPGSLEKGVIRSARILGCFLAREAGDELASSLQRRYARSAPPLTT